MFPNYKISSELLLYFLFNTLIEFDYIFSGFIDHDNTKHNYQAYTQLFSHICDVQHNNYDLYTRTKH